MATALAALGRRFHSRAELAARLAAKGFDEAVAGEVIERLTEMGYLDDLAQGRAWAEGRVRAHGEGPARVRLGLIRHGVERETAASIVGEVFSETPVEVLVEAAIDRWCRLKRVDPATAGPADLRRLAHHLSGRGFAESLLWGAIRNRRR